MKNNLFQNWEKALTPEGDIVIIGLGSEPLEQGGIALIQEAEYDEHQKRNANLILAAPDLLEVCETMLESLEDTMLDHKGSKDSRDGTWQSLLIKKKMLTNAINKAIGE